MRPIRTRTTFEPGRFGPCELTTYGLVVRLMCRLRDWLDRRIDQEVERSQKRADRFDPMTDPRAHSADCGQLGPCDCDAGRAAVRTPW